MRAKMVKMADSGARPTGEIAVRTRVKWTDTMTFLTVWRIQDLDQLIANLNNWGVRDHRVVSGTFVAREPDAYFEILLEPTHG